MDDFSYCLELLNSDDEAAAQAALFAAAPPPPATADPQMDGAITAAAFNLAPPPPLPLSDNPSNTSPARLLDPLTPVDFVGVTPPLVAPQRLDRQALLADAFFASHQNPTYLSPASDPLDPNWEAIGSYLVGQVRPGPDVTRVYKCERCGLEFPNAQAFGGHMSSHSKARRGRSDSSAEVEGRALGVRSAGQGFKKAERSKRSKLSAKKKRMMAAEDEANGFAGAAEGVSEELIYLESIDVDEEFSG